MAARPTVVLTFLAVLAAGCGGGMLHGGKLGPRWGVEAGYLSPLGGDSQDFEGGALVGATLRMGANLRKPTGLELGAAYSALDADGADASTNVLFLRARALRLVGKGGFCLAAGVQGVRQDAKQNGSELDSFTGATIDVGALAFVGRRYEVGLTYSILYESENVPGTIAVTAGFSF
jgi:hypothetical protein